MSQILAPILSLRDGFFQPTDRHFCGSQILSGPGTKLGTREALNNNVKCMTGEILSLTGHSADAFLTPIGFGHNTIPLGVHRTGAPHVKELNKGR